MRSVDHITILTIQLYVIDGKKQLKGKRNLDKKKHESWDSCFQSPLACSVSNWWGRWRNNERGPYCFFNSLLIYSTWFQYTGYIQPPI